MSKNHRAYSEKRNFIRMRVETPAIVEYASQQFSGLCLDLSSIGLQVESSAPAMLGEHVSVWIKSAHSEIADFKALAEVVRIDIQENSRPLLGLRILALS